MRIPPKSSMLMEFSMKNHLGVPPFQEISIFLWQDNGNFANVFGAAVRITCFDRCQEWVRALTWRRDPVDPSGALGIRACCHQP
jgi:hypothetical protein